MRKITNEARLPQPLVDAVKADSYAYDDDPNHYSVTTLLSPPRQVALSRKHEHEISEDASDRIWSLLGQVVHGILERADTSGIAERRLEIKVGDVRVSGGMDRYCDGVLQDYKFVTIWKFKDSGVPREYEEQLNCYAEILRQNGHQVKRLEIVGILRDWSKMAAKRDPSLPQRQIVIREVPLWHTVRAQAFLAERVAMHLAARTTLPECTADDVWAKPDVWAVKKPDAARAIKLHDSLESAQAQVSGTSLVIEHRKGERVRCENYCAVSQFCGQFKSAQTNLSSTGHSTQTNLSNPSENAQKESE